MNIEELEATFREIDEEVDSTPNFRIEAKIINEDDYSQELNIVGYEYKLHGTGGRANDKKNLLSLNLNDIAIPDDFIDERFKYTAEKTTFGDLPGVKVVQHGATPWYEVVEDYGYRCQKDDFPDSFYKITGTEEWKFRDEMIIIAPKGFIFDRASIPRIFWVLISKDDLSNVPPLFHDLLYANGGVLKMNYVAPYRTFERKDADFLFYQLMRKCGVKEWRRKLAFEAVKKFSGFAWKTKIF